MLQENEAALPSFAHTVYFRAQSGGAKYNLERPLPNAFRARPAHQRNLRSRPRLAVAELLLDLKHNAVSAGTTRHRRAVEVPCCVEDDWIPAQGSVLGRALEPVKPILGP